MPELQQKPQKRQIAVKVNIKDIINGKYFKEEGWLPNYIETRDGRRVSRVNVIGTIVFKSDEESFNYKNFIIDDGSGKISLRSFEKNDVLSAIDIGNVVLIIGRPREFNNEKYIIPEIVKKIQNSLWIQVRKLELGKEFNSSNKRITNKGDIVEEIEINNENKNTPIKEIMQEEVEEIKDLDSDIICNLIKKLDVGSGVPIEDIIKISNNKNTEKLINSLLKNGDIFEIKPGIIKVLE